MNSASGTTQAGIVTDVQIYKRNWLRDEHEPWLYAKEVESLRSYLEYVGAENGASQLFERILWAADTAAGEQSGCLHQFNIPCWQQDTLIGYMCPKCGARDSVHKPPTR